MHSCKYVAKGTTEISLQYVRVILSANTYGKFSIFMDIIEVLNTYRQELCSLYMHTSAFTHSNSL